MRRSGGHPTRRPRVLAYGGTLTRHAGPEPVHFIDLGRTCRSCGGIRPLAVVRSRGAKGCEEHRRQPRGKEVGGQEVGGQGPGKVVTVSDLWGLE